MGLTGGGKLLESDASIWILMVIVILFSWVVSYANYIYRIENEIKLVSSQLDSIVNSDRLVYNHLTGIPLYDNVLHSPIPARIDPDKIPGFCKGSNSIVVCGEGNKTHIVRVGLDKDGKLVVIHA